MKKLMLCLCLLFLFTGCSKEMIEDPIDEPKEEEQIPYDGKMVTVYVFYGEGCPHCEALFSYLENLKIEYGNYYDVVKYETWSNPQNEKLKNQVAKFLNDSAKGVPYYVIGNVSIIGYNDSFQQKIKKTIEEQFYNRDYVDIVNELKNNV